MDIELRDADTGESLGRAQVGTPDEARAFVKSKYPNRRVQMRPVSPGEGAVTKRATYGAAEGIAGPAMLGALGAGVIAEPFRGMGAMMRAGSGNASIEDKLALAQRPPNGSTGNMLQRGLARGAEWNQRGQAAVAGAMGLPGVPGEQPDLALSMGRAAGGLIYGPRTLAGAVGSVAGEAADYGAQSAGLGPLGRMMASVMGDVGGTQLTGAANRTAVRGAAKGAANIGDIRAYRQLRVLDMVPEGMREALQSARGRATRMGAAEDQAWQQFDMALRKGLNRTATGFDEIANVDATDLYREANYIFTSTPKEARGELPKVVRDIVERSRNATGEMNMSLSDLRAFHAQINELWRTANHPNASPFALGHATVADGLRTPILAAYERILQRSDEVRGAARPQFGPTLGVDPGRGHYEVNQTQPGSQGEFRTVQRNKGPGYNPAFPRKNPPNQMDFEPQFVQVKGQQIEQRFEPGREVVVPPGERGAFPKRTTPGMFKVPTPGEIETQQANTLRVALEASRQTGSEFDRLKNIGIEFASGTTLEPSKVMAALAGGTGKIGSPQVAKDFYDIVLRENPRDGARIMSQAYQDYVLGDAGDFTLKEAVKRLNTSKEIGRVWAGDEKVQHLERIVKWTSDKKSPQHPWARQVMENALGVGGATFLSGGHFPTTGSEVIASTAGYVAGRSIPRIFDYVKDNYGREGVRLFAREMLLDRDKYLRAERIARGVPKAKDLQWVNIQMRALALRQSNNAAMQTPGISQQVFGGPQP